MPRLSWVPAAAGCGCDLPAPGVLETPRVLDCSSCSLAALVASGSSEAGRLRSSSPWSYSKWPSLIAGSMSGACCHCSPYQTCHGNPLWKLSARHGRVHGDNSGLGKCVWQTVGDSPSSAAIICHLESPAWWEASAGVCMLSPKSECKISSLQIQFMQLRETHADWINSVSGFWMFVLSPREEICEPITSVNL